MLRLNLRKFVCQIKYPNLALTVIHSEQQAYRWQALILLFAATEILSILSKEFGINLNLHNWSHVADKFVTSSASMPASGVDVPLLAPDDKIVNVTSRESQWRHSNGPALFVLELKNLLRLWQHVETPRAKSAIGGNGDLKVCLWKNVKYFLSDLI